MSYQSTCFCTTKAFKAPAEKRNRRDIEIFFAGTVQAAIISQYHARGRIGSARDNFDLKEHLETIGDHLFTRLYRLSPAQFQDLCRKLRPGLERKPTRKNCCNSTKIIETMPLIRMQILAGDIYLDTGWPYGVSRTSMYELFHEPLGALHKVVGRIQISISEAECRNAAEKCTMLRRSPPEGIMAAIDGIVIKIRQFTMHDTPDPRKYFNRKGVYALCVQAALGANYKFAFLFARHAGSTHDSTAFQATLLYEFIKSGRLLTWARIAEDDAYANSYHVMTPYGGYGLSQRWDAFNFYLSSCRITVEQAFGILMSRFGMFWSLLRFSVARNTLIIGVCCKFTTT